MCWAGSEKIIIFTSPKATYAFSLPTFSLRKLTKLSQWHCNVVLSWSNQSRRIVQPVKKKQAQVSTASKLKRKDFLCQYQKVSESFCVRIVLCQNHFVSELFCQNFFVSEFFCVRFFLCQNCFVLELHCVRIVSC